jgi:hypothetical protein
LPTVLSRCQRVTVEGADERLTEDVARRVTGLLALPRPQRMLFAFGQSDGLKALLDEVKQAIMESEATGEDADGDVEDDVLDARVSAKFREVRTAVMQRVLAWHRDVAMVVCGCEGLVGNAADLDALRLAAQDLSLRAALRNVQIVEAMNRRLERYMPDETVFEHGFSRIMAGNDGKGKPSQQ